jgi:hypothetical protein
MMLLTKVLTALVLLATSVQMSFAQEPFAVVELFASEGCSSCPSAEELLSQLFKNSDHQKVFFLNFAVDYWNNLGWVDPLSNPKFSQRQYEYGQYLGVTVYTPQMIVNGQSAFVGSDGTLAKKYISQELKTKPHNGIKLKLESKSSLAAEISYVCENISPNKVINFALVEDGIESHVDAGENQGRILKHDRMVRELRSLDVSQKEGHVSFTIVSSKGNGHFAVIAFLQDKQDLRIEAVDQINLQ